MKRLDGKTALITGAARGIGEAIAIQFAEQGATVIVSDIDDQMGQALVDSSKLDMHYLHLDVSDESQWITCAKSIEDQFGGLDILVEKEIKEDKMRKQHRANYNHKKNHT